MNVLSIQSHVAYGYVGNRAAAFPLQRLGFDVWAVNTVQFSNHTGYGAWTGEVLSAGQIETLLDGIFQRVSPAACDAVLSGYMGDAGLGSAILGAVAKVRAANPKAFYACDPVMGDIGRGIFVRDGIPEFLREKAVPAADVITPNQFELNLLTGVEIVALDDALRAARAALALGPRIVVVTSLRHAASRDDEIEMLAVTQDAAWRVATPMLPIVPAPNGAGDTVTALFLANLLVGRGVEEALGLTASAIFAVMAATLEAGTRELQLVAAQDAFADPPRRFSVERVA